MLTQTLCSCPPLSLPSPAPPDFVSQRAAVRGAGRLRGAAAAALPARQLPLGAAAVLRRRGYRGAFPHHHHHRNYATIEVITLVIVVHPWAFSGVQVGNIAVRTLRGKGIPLCTVTAAADDEMAECVSGCCTSVMVHLTRKPKALTAQLVSIYAGSYTLMAAVSGWATLRLPATSAVMIAHRASSACRRGSAASLLLCVSEHRRLPLAGAQGLQEGAAHGGHARLRLLRLPHG